MRPEGLTEADSFESPMRPLPELTPWTEWFWTSRCRWHPAHPGLHRLRHVGAPPGPHLPGVPEPVVGPTEVSGRATVVGYTVNQTSGTPTCPRRT